ncbi:MAG TPA: hypothetical protein VFT22_07365 [Kofleriaceae bacterium]|nr:hypothetical protein [Kofleriaceae bacterium]
MNQRQTDVILAQEPPRDYAVHRCVQAWSDLSTCRAIGMTVGPVPWTAIVAWCDFHGLDHEATELMIYVIRALDNERAEEAALEARQKAALGSGRGETR